MISRFTLSSNAYLWKNGKKKLYIRGVGHTTLSAKIRIIIVEKVCNKNLKKKKKLQWIKRESCPCPGTTLTNQNSIQEEINL